MIDSLRRRFGRAAPNGSTLLGADRLRRWTSDGGWVVDVPDSWTDDTSRTVAFLPPGAVGRLSIFTLRRTDPGPPTDEELLRSGNSHAADMETIEQPLSAIEQVSAGHRRLSVAGRQRGRFVYVAIHALDSGVVIDAMWHTADRRDPWWAAGVTAAMSVRSVDEVDEEAVGANWAAGFFDDAGREEFERELHAELTARGWTWHQDADSVIAAGDGIVGERTFGLMNLAQTCAQSERVGWPDIIRAHFDVLSASDSKIPSTFAVAAPMLRPRLARPRELVIPAGMTLVTPATGLLPELEVVMVIDQPSSISYLTDDRVAGWPDAEALLVRAIENVRDEPPPQRSAIGTGEANVYAETGASYFVSSRLLLLAEFPDMRGARGALVAVPNRHTFFYHPIRTADAVLALRTIAYVAAKEHEAGPGSIAPNVFWWRAGTLTDLPVLVTDDGVQAFPPDEFVEELNRLPAGSTG